MSQAKPAVGAFAYVLTFVGLVVLATLSLLLSFLHWPVWDLIVSLLIASLKAGLVLFFFMHLAVQRFTNRLAILISLAFVALLVGLTSADVATRHTFAEKPEPPATEAFYGR